MVIMLITQQAGAIAVRWLSAGSTFWVIGELRAVPDCNNPYCFFFNTIEEAVRSHYYFAKRKVREFRQNTPRLRKFMKSRQDILCFFSERNSSGRILSPNEGKGGKELIAGGQSKQNFQELIPFRSLSASAKTSSMSYPSPASISFSPRASKRSISNSC